MSNPRGDPEGRRLSARRAAQLAEAGLLLRAVEVLLRNAGADDEVAHCLGMAHRVATRERSELQRAYGRILSRRRFKYSSGHPLLAGLERSELFIDEGGSADPRSTSSQPAFALAGVAMTPEASEAYVARADSIKLRFFGTTAHTFHEPAMRRHEQLYHFQGDADTRREFTEAIDELVQGTDCVVFGAGIRKAGFEQEFVGAGIDPYLPTNAYSVAILMLLERYVDYLLADGRRRMGRLIFESQGPKEDAFHQSEFARLLLDGTQWVPESAFQQAIEPGAQFVAKSGSHPTELADMFARDLYEWTRSACTIEPRRWDMFTKKMYCRDDGSRGRFGVKVFPDSDIRARVEEHRSRRIALQLPLGD